ncbi:MAG: HPF/RaiA family ribosome-associated protein [Candidatus Latescibacterota bacterium]
MQIPLELVFRNTQKTDSIEQLIREKVSKLEQICNYIISCRVAVEKPQEHQRVGNPYRVRIDIKVPPGHEIIVVRDSSHGDMHDPLSTIIRDAFSAARRQLKGLVERQRQEIKAHPRQTVEALVSRLFKVEGYGFLRTIEGREIYFHRNSVIHDHFDRLQPGTGVRFEEELGEEGPQATSVQIIERIGPKITEMEEI